MNAALKKYKAWRAGKQDRWLETWAQRRADGKTRFVIEGALTYGLTIVGASDAFDWIFYGAHSLSLSRLILRLLIGFPIALVWWSGAESQYWKALKKSQAKASLTSQLPPDNQRGHP